VRGGSGAAPPGRILVHHGRPASAREQAHNTAARRVGATKGAAAAACLLQMPGLGEAALQGVEERMSISTG
jgi:hypothetical protein